ncbi:unnamed protein product [Symbiodinium sp. CCMP2456]|nr:unnamed protein product [Symbiodinium sp. CCMP2456]
MAGFFVWSEPRLGSTGFKDTYVVSIGTKSKAICRRQDQAEAERLRVKLEASKLTTVPELKDFLKKLLLEEHGIDAKVGESAAVETEQKEGLPMQPKVWGK